ncbi:protein trichome birefringence-like 28 [Zingiber officinale]|uniref:protein trichome birefringence-like 28 n=1 Tax=Zingiber officinale TaxID=94328 RepID=UPI001C4B8F0A|nr:protein trichome birefringence-like 28 [Zingiber officinale]
MMARRKLSFLAANKIDLKHSSSFGGVRRKSCKYSVFVVISLVLLLFTFMYNEDVKSIGEHPFGSRDYSQIEFPIRYDIGHQQSKQAVEEKESTKLIEKAEEKAAAEKDRAVVVDVVNSSAKQEEKREVHEVKAPKEEEFHDVKIPAMDVEERKEDLREVNEAPALEEEGRKEELREVKEPIMDKEERKENSREAKAPATEIKEAVKKAERQRIILDVPENCDLFDGKWVYDDENYPIYKEAECQFLTEQVTCMRNGRRNDRFQKWRWQPKDCTLPRFDAEVMLERLRGKRLMFVGDSLSRNQWESMVCLVQSVVPSNRKSLTKHGSFSVLRLEEYDATVEFYWAPFLVESNSDDPKIHSLPDRIIMPKSIDRHGKNWKNVDYLVFNTYIWWMNTPTVKVLRGSFNESSTEYDEVERPLAYRRVLNTWAKWVQSNVNPNRTMVFFMSMSPNHIRSTDWGNPTGIKCALETEPVANWSGWQPIEVGTDWRLFSVAENVIGRLRKKVPATFVKITAMSELRKDAHTSVHTLRQGKLLTAEQQADPARFADCVHWCLPGLPDTWNEFLYTRIASSPWKDR